MAERSWIDAFQGHDARLDDIAPLPASWECDLTTGALHWSPGVFDLFGLPRGAPPSRDAIVAMYVGDSRAMLDRLRAEAVECCGSFTFDAQIRRVDGALRWMRLTADVIVSDGKAVRLYGTKQDITREIAQP